MKLFCVKKTLVETQIHGNWIASSEMTSTYYVLCFAVRKNIRKMQRDRTKLASADSLLGGRTSREAGHNGAKNSMKSHLKRFLSGNRWRWHGSFSSEETFTYCTPQRQIKKNSLVRFAFLYICIIELKLQLFWQIISVRFALKSRNFYPKALTPLCWKDRVGWQKWLTFVQKEFNMHNNDNVLEFAPDKINKAFKN